MRRRPTTAALVAEKSVLASIARGRTLADILQPVTRFVEARAKGTRSTILIMDQDRRRLRPASVSIRPASWRAAVAKFEIGPSAASCGTAAFTGEPVITRDIAVDPLWSAYKDPVLKHGMRTAARLALHA